MGCTVVGRGDDETLGNSIPVGTGKLEGSADLCSDVGVSVETCGTGENDKYGAALGSDVGLCFVAVGTLV